MKMNFFPKWLRDLSISRKLYLIVGIMAVLIALELMMLLFSVQVLSSVRAIVEAEGAWSRAQKDAVTCLQQYGITRNEKEFREFEDALNVTSRYTQIRLEMAKKKPNFDLVRQQLIVVHTQADDIEGSLCMLKTFRNE